jgi:hypothetical protein
MEAGYIVADKTDTHLLINLKRNVIYTILKDAGTGAINAQVVDINGRKTWIPDTETTALLIYPLARDDNDRVLLSDYMAFVTEKFPGKDTEIEAFLKALYTQYKVLQIAVADEGIQGASDLDPVDLFSGNLTWQEPLSLTFSSHPICKSNTFFTMGTTNPGGYVGFASGR